MDAAPSLLLDAAQADFICGGVGISAATSRPGGMPAMARALGCKVAQDGSSVTLLLAATPGAALLEGIRCSGAIAAVFSQPSTHRTLQLKGADARIVPPDAGDELRVARYVDAFVAEVVPLGYPDALIRTLLAHAPDDIVGVRFSPSSAFSQTPGPQAGQPVAGSV